MSEGQHIASARRFLSLALANPSMLSARWHPLGFVLMKLEPAPPELGFTRLHVWPEGRRHAQEPRWLIHDHVFALDSLVLVGEIENLEFETCEGSEHRIYSVRYENGASVLVATDQLVMSTLTKRERYCAGDRYSIAQGVFHRSWVESGSLCGTLVVTKEHVTADPRVLGALDALETYRYERHRCEAGLAQALVERVADSF